jgi:hypothetical protein
MWRFLGFVMLVIAGLAGVFYYVGLKEEKMVVERKSTAEPFKVASPLKEAGPVVGKPSPVAGAQSSFTGPKSTRRPSRRSPPRLTPQSPNS